MREILFRGKRRDQFGMSLGEHDGEWVHGHYRYISAEDCGFHDEIWVDDGTGFFTVYSETVGQYTGLEDRNAKKIFDGDLVRDNAGWLYLVCWHEEALAWFVKGGKRDLYIPLADLDGCVKGGVEISGNIHDNAGLWEANNA